MILLNFSHPLTADHLKQIKALQGQKVERVIKQKAQFDQEQLLDQVMTCISQRRVL
ncbi:MAG: hypothetical protein HY731_09005 [Candidatus Tectomicrobia bacterium]|nr:hypothetical protein [Candidatus Tectomicrobia bacterium]